MANKDDLEKLEKEFHTWKLDQQLKDANKAGQWKTCVLAWSIITGFVAAISTLGIKYSDAVYAGVNAFWIVMLEKFK
jgi:hypothetical protein